MSGMREPCRHCGSDSDDSAIREETRTSDARLRDYSEMITEVLRSYKAVDVINQSRYNVCYCNARHRS